MKKMVTEPKNLQKWYKNQRQNRYELATLMPQADYVTNLTNIARATQCGAKNEGNYFPPPKNYSRLRYKNRIHNLALKRSSSYELRRIGKLYHHSMYKLLQIIFVTETGRDYYSDDTETR